VIDLLTLYRIAWGMSTCGGARNRGRGWEVGIARDFGPRKARKGAKDGKGVKS
jgi:hypothetical protein